MKVNKMKSRIKLFAQRFLGCVLGWVWGVSFLWGCGASPSYVPQLPDEESSLATLHNFSRWKHIWTGEYIVTFVRDKHVLSAQNLNLIEAHAELSDLYRKRLYQAVQENLQLFAGKYPSLGLFPAWKPEDFKVEVLGSLQAGASEKAQAFSLYGFTDISELDFVRVVFPRGSKLHGEGGNLLSSSSLGATGRGLFLQTLPETLEFEQLQAEWQTLAGMQGVLWVDANLESELFVGRKVQTLPLEQNLQASQGSSLLSLQQRTPYEFPPEKDLGKLGAWRHIERIRASLSWSELYDAKGQPRYQFNKNPKCTQGDLNCGLNTTYVAVIDTGVDYENPELKSSMFINPRESGDSAVCGDNDGNGYWNDVYGIDASVEMSTWNEQVRAACAQNGGKPAQPRVGVADVGGPGRPCLPENGDSCGHGTHVAGIIAARHGGLLNTLGVCPSCKIVSIRATRTLVQKDGSPANSAIDDASQIRALAYLTRLTDEKGRPYVSIINMSLGKYFTSRAVGKWVREVYNNYNMLVVAAAGNQDTDTPNYPAAYDVALSVCATSEPESRGMYSKAHFSNFGVWVDICAPGENIASTYPGTPSGAMLSGTSQAAPMVAGAAGYLKSLNPLLSAAKISELLKTYSDAIKLYNTVTAGKPTNRPYTKETTDRSTQFYLLGQGFLDVAQAARAVVFGEVRGEQAGVDDVCSYTEKRKAVDPTERKLCTSYAALNGYVGLQSQLDGGCVLGSVASTHASLISTKPSLRLRFTVPFLVLCGYFLVYGIRRGLKQGFLGKFFKREF